MCRWSIWPQRVNGVICYISVTIRKHTLTRYPKYDLHALTSLAWMKCAIKCTDSNLLYRSWLVLDCLIGAINEPLALVVWVFPWHSPASWMRLVFYRDLQPFSRIFAQFGAMVGTVIAKSSSVCPWYERLRRGSILNFVGMGDLVY